MKSISPLALFIASVAAQSYEYIIIGSGPGGGPLAANLARAGHSVLLLEAGEDHGSHPLQRIPSFNAQNSEDPTMSWAFYVSHYNDTEQAYRDSKFSWRKPDGDIYVGRSPPGGSEPLGILYPRAGALGGCSNHNAANAALPPDADWDHIANLTGDKSWRAENMRKYYQRLERNHYAPNGTEGHGFSGWLGINRNDIELMRPQQGFVELLKNAFKVLSGTAPNSTDAVLGLLQRDMNRLDPHRYERNDLYQIPLHADNLRQRSSSQTYLKATIEEKYENGTQRYPLTIMTNALASKVLFDTTGGKPRAIGVEYLQGQALYRADRRSTALRVGVPRNATATREVIVAGGAFNTPQLLKLSGIGPREELESFEIPVVVDLPAVGTNLQDNYEGGFTVEASQDFLNIYANCTFLAPGDPCLRQWEEQHSGPYGEGAAPVGLLYRSSVSENADADLFFFGATAFRFHGHFDGFSYEAIPPSTFFWSMVKMQTQNRAGYVKLRSADPQDVPEINFNFFAEGREHDLQALSEGMALARRIINATGAPYAPFREIDPPPGADVKQTLLDETFSHHASSSCPIGPSNSSSACVDSRFRVQGVDGLRVVDASVFPRTPGAFPVIPTFMISEKAMDVVLEDIE